MSTNSTHELSIGDFNAELQSISHMSVKRWKIAKALVATTMIIAFAGFAIEQGADPTTTAWLALATAALINGIEMSELVAVWSDISEKANDDD
ncbi:MAG: hypothetical protein ACOCP2_03575 [Halohasta sp.]